MLAELTRQVQPSNRNVMLYASAGVVLIAAVFAGMIFRHRQQLNEVTLPITTMATANGAKAKSSLKRSERIRQKLPNRHL